MIENNLEKLKSEYQQIKTPDYLISNGWLDLSLKLSENGRSVWRLFFGRGLVFASVILALSGAVVGVSQAAKPGDLLFPVRVMSEKVAEKVVGKADISVIGRANDLIDQSKKNSSAVDKASEEYQRTLEQSKQDAQKSGKTEDFKQTLNEQEKKLNDAQSGDHKTPEIQRAIEDTVKIRGEVKGAKSSDTGENKGGGENSNQQNGNSNSNSGNSHNGNR